MLQTALTILGIIGATIAILDAYSKVNAAYHQAKLRDAELDKQIGLIRNDVDHQSEKLDTHFHGLKASIEHLKTRLLAELKETSSTLNDVENYLQKNTPYEKRSR